MRTLIYVASASNLITGITIRNTLVHEGECDIAICNHKGLDKLIDRVEQSGIFNHVYTVNWKTRANSKFRKLYFMIVDYINPLKGLTTILDIDKSQIYGYDDVFFYNFDIFFDDFIRSMKTLKADTKYHRYTAAFGSFMDESPRTKQRYKGLLGYITRKRFGYIAPRFLEFDFYRRNPEFCLYPITKHTYELPKIDKEDKDLINILNDIWISNNHDCINETIKYVYFDTGFETKKDTKEELSIISTVKKYLPAEDFWIKPKPGFSLSRYEGLDVNVWDLGTDYPFEMYCINNSIEDMVLITSLSSAPAQPFLVFGTKVHIWFLDFGHSDEESNFKDVAEKVKQVYEKMKGTLDVEIVKDENELKQLIERRVQF